MSKWSRRPPQFIDINQFIENETLAPHYLTIPGYVKATRAGTSIPEEKVTPLELAERLEADARRALALVRPIDIAGDPSLRYEVADVKVWAHLSLYFAEKLRGGVALRAFRTGGGEAQQAKAVGHLEKAATRWENVIGITQPLYREMPLTHKNGSDDNHFHWAKLRDNVQRDIEVARRAVPASGE